MFNVFFIDKKQNRVYDIEKCRDGDKKHPNPSVQESRWPVRNDMKRGLNITPEQLTEISKLSRAGFSPLSRGHIV
jgi:hypothetical protein